MIKFAMMVNIIVAFALGFVFAIMLRLIIIELRAKRGLYEIEHKALTLSPKMKVMLREIVFKFSIKKFNRDFLLNIKSQSTYLIQIMHRSHFPELCNDKSDIKFGLAVYIPLNPLTPGQRQK